MLMEDAGFVLREDGGQILPESAKKPKPQHGGILLETGGRLVKEADRVLLEA